MKAGRGYIIRFFDENNNASLFFMDKDFSSTPWSTNLEASMVFITNEDAVKKLIDIKKDTKKRYPKGYLYISKVFYIEKPLRYAVNGTKTHLVASKLTKPDRHDFLQAI